MRIPKPILDRRRALRIRESLPFQIGHKDYECQAVSINISSSGIYCLVDRNIPVMTQLDLCLFLPSVEKKRAKKIELRGVVVRREKQAATGKFFIAIYFSRAKPVDREFLEKYILQRLKK
ncbi:MAG: PilZ domain-containing protein [Candidatus Omnitrophica bacterium]|nr:PilZ domain-containing protein [Candidatus Omnitrophota bacterium]